ncbi:MAG: LysR family transcriptional regulator [Burkholderiaceae bacterium]|nr:LysR family transcriptional regulator [Burkholderiaceae bacterium]
MRAMDGQKADLNLLQVFDALMEDGNLTRAGFRLGLSQPAMSHALSRLRALTGDVLFVRVPSGMKPTDHAVQIAPSVREGLTLLRSAMKGEATFDPQSAVRQFQILLSDIGELAYLPRLMKRLGEIAPGIRVRALNRPREAYADTFVSGEADLAIGFLPGLSAGFYQQRLFSDSYVCLAREDHPRIRKRLSLSQFLDESHVLIEPGGSGYVSAGHQTSTTTLIEHYLARQGLRRRIALRVPHFMVVSDVVQSCDLIATVPSYVMRYSPPRSGVKILPLPFDAPRFHVKQFWHQRHHKDPGNRWLRAVVQELFAKG